MTWLQFHQEASFEQSRATELQRDESLDMDSGRESVATEERLDVEDNDRNAATPLPTNEMIVGKWVKIRIFIMKI